MALITGANKGLGKEIGRQLGALGYTVVLTARDAQAGETVVAELVATGYINDYLSTTTAHPRN